MPQVRIIRHDLGGAFAIGGLVGRRDGVTFLIVHPDLPLREIIGLARELLTPLEMNVLRTSRTASSSAAA
jgi:hypothetical protein